MFIFGAGAIIVLIIIIIKASTNVVKQADSAGMFDDFKSKREADNRRLLGQRTFVLYSGRGRHSMGFASKIKRDPSHNWFIEVGWQQHLFFYKTPDSLSPEFYLTEKERYSILYPSDSTKDIKNSIPLAIHNLVIQSRGLH